MYCVPVGMKWGGLPFCNPTIRIVKFELFVEIIQSTILRDLLFSENKPQKPDYVQYIVIFKNKQNTYDDLNKIKNLKSLEFFHFN